MPSPSMERFGACVRANVCMRPYMHRVDVVGGDGSAAIVIRHLIVVINETKTNGTMRIIIIVFISLFLLYASSKCRYIVFIYITELNSNSVRRGHKYCETSERMGERAKERESDGSQRIDRGSFLVIMHVTTYNLHWFVLVQHIRGATNSTNAQTQHTIHSLCSALAMSLPFFRFCRFLRFSMA